MTLNTYRYHRRRAKEVPVQKYTCTNCGREFEYANFAKMNRVNHYCQTQCKVEWNYFWNDMSERQMNILSRLINNNGRDVMPQSSSLDSLLFKVAPLVDVIDTLPDGNVEIRITARGLYWHSLKANIIT